MTTLKQIIIECSDKTTLEKYLKKQSISQLLDLTAQCDQLAIKNKNDPLTFSFFNKDVRDVIEKIATKKFHKAMKEENEGPKNG